jgi:hypothetical protein
MVRPGGGANVLRGQRRSTHGGRITPTAASEPVPHARNPGPGETLWPSPGPLSHLQRQAATALPRDLLWPACGCHTLPPGGRSHRRNVTIQPSLIALGTHAELSPAPLWHHRGSGVRARTG